MCKKQSDRTEAVFLTCAEISFSVLIVRFLLCLDFIGENGSKDSTNITQRISEKSVKLGSHTLEKSNEKMIKTFAMIEVH